VITVTGKQSTSTELPHMDAEVVHLVSLHHTRMRGCCCNLEEILDGNGVL
jgi:hypothetical protein